MNRIILTVIAVAFMMLVACKQGGMDIVIENESPLMRVDEAVVITRASLESEYGNIAAEKIPVLMAPDGSILASQYDDLTGDGNWDELFLLLNMEPESSVTYTLKFVDPKTLPIINPRTNIRFARIDETEYVPLITANRLSADAGLAAGIFQFEGPGWENDRVGFRNYFDIRNGIDIFGKLTTNMVLDHVDIDENYHALQDWGMDILKVGKSLGAGSLALSTGGKLHRVAPDAVGSYELITQGPLRSVFRLRFDDWVIDDNTYSLIHEISIQGGAWFYDSKVYLETSEGQYSIMSGITSIDLDDKTAYREIRSEGVVTVGTHGKQAIVGEILGMAIMVDEDIYAGYEYVEEGEDITDTFLINMSNIGQRPVSFRFYSCWELSEPRFYQADYFYEFLELESRKKAQPLRVVYR